MYAHVVGWGKYVPRHVLTNDELARTVDTTDEWIRERTGIGQRHLAEDDETTASMAIQAARQALDVARLNPARLDLIIVATATPDHVFPATACLIQDALGASHAAAFDLSAGCSGFVYGLSVAANLLTAGAYQTALVIGAETLSRIVNWTDRNTCVLFGDGAGAVILQVGENEGGVLASVLGADGSGGDLLRLPAGGSKIPTSHRSVTDGLHFIEMEGRQVFRFAVRTMPAATREVLAKVGLSPTDLDLLIPHQANQRIIEAAAKSLELSAETVYSNLERHGNTSAASIPIALCEAVEEGRIQPGNLVVAVGFGAGLTWGAAAIRWTRPLPAPLPRWQQFLRRLRYFLARFRSRVRRVRRRLSAHWVRDDLNGREKDV
ncbi:MAG: ketoacyl-ACP synthase III [Chloroflexi bacterium]|nr:ketoacyl-ACP synthase III [Chloroflexota bacterium]MBU1751547.1 ketoacyl-ACP synthase III [Chloroflexota bacterium]